MADMGCEAAGQGRGGSCLTAQAEQGFGKDAQHLLAQKRPIIALNPPNCCGMESATKLVGVMGQ